MTLSSLPFIKASALGNDFIIIDSQDRPLPSFSQNQIRRLCHRQLGVGCDQLILIKRMENNPPQITFYNSDGSLAEACGNGTRCVAKLLLQESARSEMDLNIDGKIIRVACSDNQILVNMGMADFSSSDIPVTDDYDPQRLLDITKTTLVPDLVNIGNPHLIFRVQSLKEIEAREIGPKLENHPFFPKRINVNFVEILSPSSVKLKVWERGAGETLACGTGACATVAALHKKQLVGEMVDVFQEGGDLMIQVDSYHHIWMKGPADLIFQGFLF
jgi:diaminopimelate epimerase